MTSAEKTRVIGVVTRVEVEDKTEWQREREEDFYIPINIRVNLKTSTSGQAYVSTRVGKRIYPDDKEPYFERLTAANSGQFAWVDESGEPLIQRGDILEVDGVVDSKVSQNGRPYDIVSRASIHYLARPD